MRQFITSFVGYMVDGAVNVTLYYRNKIMPGSKVTIRVHSQPPLTKVSYFWEGNENEKTVKILFNRCKFNVEVPKNKNVLTIITEVRFQSGEKVEHKHSFEIDEINNMP